MTLAPMLSKNDGQLVFTQPTQRLLNQVRAMNPWPGAFILHRDQILKIHAAQSIDDHGTGSITNRPEPGTKIVVNGLPCIVASDGIIMFTEVQPAGKKVMSGRDFLLGNKDWDR
jgi:methionyl-tRNA formyltransferase